MFAGIFLIFALTHVYAQKHGLPENNQNIIRNRYQKIDYRLPRYPSDYPLRNRFYFLSDAGLEANWESSKAESAILFNALLHAGLGFRFTPVHALEASFIYASHNNRYNDFASNVKSENMYGANLNYVMNFTAFGNKTADIHCFEVLGLAGVEYRSSNENMIGMNAGIRVVCNPLPLVGVYAQSGMSMLHSYGSQRRLTTLPYINAGFILRFGKPQIYLGNYLPPFALKTNLLFDLATALNFEIEFPIYNKFSVAAEWVFPWWTLDNHTVNSKRSRLQILNGNLEARYWFGNRNNKGLLNGWFAGVYGGGGLYDVEWKGKGVQGEFFIAAGLSGGYSHRIARHLSLEYSLGIGVLSTDYRSYKAHFCEDDSWYAIRDKRGRYTWIGPTKAKVSLVWMINELKKKGGR